MPDNYPSALSALNALLSFPIISVENRPNQANTDYRSQYSIYFPSGGPELPKPRISFPNQPEASLTKVRSI